MAETVLSMARSMLSSALSKAASAAAAEMSLLMGVKKDIWFIKDELKTMQAFLMTFDVIEKKDKLLKVWVEQVKDLSYDIEDSLDEFMVHVGSRSLSQQLMKLKDRHRIAIQIRDLKSRVEEVSNRNTRYNLIKPSSYNNIDEKDSYLEDVRSFSANNIDEAGLVGFNNPKEDVLRLIGVHANDGPAQVISVAGMGGLGKTTLVRKVYASTDIADNFSCRAWITVSQSFDRTELLREMVKQLFGDDPKQQNKQVKDLSAELIRGLKEARYFVVLDDLWEIDAWSWINQLAFPINNTKGSRVLVTTRDSGIAEHCASSPSLVYCLEPLQPHHAKKLLLRKTNKSYDDIKRANSEKIFDLILKKCGGLPLAIVTVGGVLATKHIERWNIFYQQLPSELEINPNLGGLRMVVTLSYTHLPSHLKSCFLYLSIFPVDFEIKRKCLVDRWIAEGFVGAKVGMTIEEVANSYFDELINRSMIIPSKFHMHGTVKSCRVHDIMRDITVSISREENFVFLSEEYGTSTAPENIRHLSCHGNQKPQNSFDLSHVRSLSVFNIPQEQLASLFSAQLRMLRVLDLGCTSFDVTQRDIKNIGLFRHLKYLSISKYSCIHTIPRSIGRLQGLQTLDMQRSYITTLPPELTKLQSLCSLRCSRQQYFHYFDIDEPKECLLNTLRLPIFVRASEHAEVIPELHMAVSSQWSETEGVKVPKGIRNLKELQILEVVDVERSGNKVIQELGKLTQLRKLGVVGVTKRNVSKLCKALQKLSSLSSLRADAKLGHTLILDQLYSTSSPPPLLQSLKLDGHIAEIPNWVGKLVKLVKLQLKSTELEGGGSLKVLEELPNLTCLRLSHRAYNGEELVLHQGGFMKLKILYLDWLMNLKKVTFEEGASPQLESIFIRDCPWVAEVSGTNSLQNLKEISHFEKYKLVKVERPQRQVEMHGSHPVPQVVDQYVGDCEVSEVTEQPEASISERGESSCSRAEPDGLGIPPIAATTKLKRSHSCPASTSSKYPAES